MTTENAKLLTIFTEAALESRLINDFERLGAHGYTISNARGGGSHGLRNAEWGASSNIRIEIIGSSATVQQIAEHLKNEYYKNYAMVSFLNDIEVLRPEKFNS